MKVVLRWAMVAGLFLMAAGLGGCRVMSAAEYERMKEYEELAEHYRNQHSSLSKDIEQMTAARQQAERSLQAVRSDLQGARAELTAAQRRLDDQASLAAAAVESARALSRQLDDLRARNKELADNLSHRSVDVGGGVETIYGPEGYGYRIPGAMLFDSGRAELRDTARATLDKIVAQLQQTNEMIRVCGYTDSDPIRASAWESNFHLSGARALSVLNYLASKGIPRERMHFAGFGEYALITDPSGEEDKERSRRAEIWLLTASPTVEGATAR